MFTTQSAQLPQHDVHGHRCEKQLGDVRKTLFEAYSNACGQPRSYDQWYRTAPNRNTLEKLLRVAECTPYPSAVISRPEDNAVARAQGIFECTMHSQADFGPVAVKSEPARVTSTGHPRSI